MICDDGEADEYFQKLIELSSEDKHFQSSNNVREVCYAQLGKKIVKKVSKSPLYQPSFNNLHIRGELMPSILDHVKEKAKIAKNSVFVLPN